MKNLYAPLQFCSICAFAALCFFTPPIISYLLLAALLVRIILFLRPTKGVPIQRRQDKKCALLVLDIQEAMCGEAGCCKHSGHFVEDVNQQIKTARQAGWKTIFIRQEFQHYDAPFCLLSNGGRLLEGTAGAAFCKGLTVDSDVTVVKHQQDAFTSKQLGQYLEEHEITTLMIVGLEASSCVLKTALGAVNRGYWVTVLQQLVLCRSVKATERVLRKFPSKGISLR